MLAKIIKSSIKGNKTQKFLAFLTIFLASLLISAMLNITLGIGNEISKELRKYGSNILVLPKGNALSIDIGTQKFEPLKNENYLDESDLHLIKEIFWRNNVVGFVPFLSAKTEISGKKVELIGTYFDKNMPITDEEDFKTGVKNIFGYWKIDGEFPDDNSTSQTLIGDELAHDLGLKIGDEIDLKGLKIKITGVLSYAGEYENKLIAPIKLAQILASTPQKNLIGKVEKVEVSALTIPEDDLSLKARRNSRELDQLEYDKWYCTAYVSSIAFQIEEDYKSVVAKPQLQISDAESAVVGKIQSLMGVVSIISLFVASIAISSLMIADIYRRTKEIGLIKALGASNLQIYLIFAVESITTAIFSSLVGCVFGYLVSEIIAYQIFAHSVAISPIVLPITIFFAILIALLGSLFPMRNIVNLLPAEVLYGSK